MSDEVTRLVITPKPEPDESAVGYTVRLTEHNGYETPTVILGLAGLDNSALQHCQFVFGGQWDLPTFSRLTGAAVPELEPMRYVAAISEGHVHRFLAFGRPVRRYFINTRQPKVCPDCLRERGCCLKVWELTPVTACPRHRRVLLDECPGCRERITWHRTAVSICPCGYDWREAPPPPVEVSELHAVRRIHQLCGLPSGEDSSRVATVETSVDGLDLEHYLYALSFVAGQHGGFTDAKGRFSSKGKRNAELHEGFSKAASVLEGWPTNFESLLDWRRTLPNDTGGRTGLHKDFGSLYHGLYYNLAQPAFDFMRRAFEDYVARRWSGGYVGVIRRRRGTVLGERKYTSKTEARKRLRVDAAYLDGLIEAGKLEAVVRTRGKKRMYLIEHSGLERLEHELQESLTAEEVAEVLNVGPMVIPDLVRYGCLKPHRGPSIDGMRFWRFTRSAARELIDRLEDLVSQGSDRQGAVAVDFSTALRALSRRGYGLGSFLRAVLDGKISPCGKSRARGIKSLLFKREDIRTLRPACVPA